MFIHDDIWKAIDRLATTFGYSPSGLAKKAGLDPTTFNRSKRHSAEGKPRWPSTESIAKILSVTGVTMTEFTSFIEESRSGTATPPGARIALRTIDGVVLAGELLKNTQGSLTLKPEGTAQRERTVAMKDIEWLARITWEQ